MRRDLGLHHAVLTVIGLVVGSGIFALPAVVFRQAQAPGLGLAAWVVGGLISLAAGLTVAEVAAALPRAGGTYVYLRTAYGEWMAFLQGWASFLAYYPGLQATVTMLFTTYLTALIPLSPAGQLLVGLGCIAGLTAVNCLGVRFGGWVQVIATLGKLVPIALLIGFGLTRLSPGHFTPVWPTGKPVPVALATAVLPVLWAYDGWINVGLLAEEVKRPQRNLPLALIGGLTIVTLIYTFFNLALVGAVGLPAVTASDKPVLPLARILFGEKGSQLITLGMLVSMFGTLNAIILTAPRYYLAMARDGLFPAARLMARVHPRYGTPVAIMWLNALWTAVMLLSGRFEQLLNLVVFVSWLFYLLTMVGVLVLRRTRPDLPRPYRVWGYPVIPLIGILSGAWVVWSSLTTEPTSALLSLGLTLSGLPVYALLRRRTGPATAGPHKGE